MIIEFDGAGSLISIGHLLALKIGKNNQGTNKKNLWNFMVISGNGATSTVNKNNLNKINTADTQIFIIWG